MQRCRN